MTARKTHAPHRRPTEATFVKLKREAQVAELWFDQHLSTDRIAEVLSVSPSTAKQLVKTIAGPDEPPLVETAKARNAGWDFTCDNLRFRS